MAQKPDFTPAMIAAELTEARGLTSVAARRLGCSHDTVSRAIKRYKVCKDAQTNAKEELKDFAESRIYQAIADGDTTMTIFFAKTQMRDRGYSERFEVTGAEGGPLAVTGAFATYKVSADEAGNIFDILAATGALAAKSDASAPDEVHPGASGGEHLPEAGGVPVAATS